MSEREVCVVIPVFNEQAVLGETIEKLTTFLTRHLRQSWEVVIADNGSTDATLQTAFEIQKQFLKNVRVEHLPVKGRGRALKKAWSDSGSKALLYMDADLSTSLESLLPMLQSLSSDRYDLVIGSRMMKGASTQRSLKREVTSRVYNLLTKVALHTRISDAQCGFKGITKSAASILLPLVEDDGWFMDTELLVLAEKMGFRILEIPVEWKQGKKSTVNVLETSIHDIKGILRMRRKLYRGNLRNNPQNALANDTFKNKLD